MLAVGLPYSVETLRITPIESGLPTTSVDQIGNTLATWFGMSAGDIAYAFPNLANWSAGVRNVGFI